VYGDKMGGVRRKCAMESKTRKHWAEESKQQ